MDFEQLYSFLFESYTGLAVLIGACMVICIVLCFIMERKTRRTFVDRGPETDEDEWSLFDDDDDEEEEEDD